MTAPASLVLLPGLLNDARLFDPLIGALDGQADAMVADTASDDSVAAMAHRILAAAPQRFALLGFSLGGYVAFEILRRAPDRVERVALIDSSARPDSAELRQRRLQMLSQVEIGQFKGVTQRLLPQLIHPSRLEDKALTGRIAAMAAAIGKDGFIRQQRAILSRPDSRPLLAAINCPAVVICGADDRLTPPALSREIAEGIAGARLTMIPQCGHVAPLERPQEVAGAVLEWLAVRD